MHSSATDPSTNPPGTMLPERGHKHRRKLPECANCNYRFREVDNFCPNCGQENHDLNIPLGHVFLETLESIFHFDTKFWSTFKAILFKPGLLTAEFNEGHRVRYMPPIRLYFFVSFVFFLLLSNGLGKHTQRRLTTINELENQHVHFTVDNVRYTQEDLVAVARHNTTATADSVIKAKKAKPDFMSRLFVRQMAKFRGEGIVSFKHTFFRNASLLMFLLMPLFALLLRLVHWHPRRLYVQFLFFSVHYHTFLFLLLGMFWLITAFVVHWSLGVLAGLIPIVYLWAGIRRAFPQGKGRAFWKTLVVSLSYGLSLAFAMLITIIISLALF